MGAGARTRSRWPASPLFTTATLADFLAEQCVKTAFIGFVSLGVFEYPDAETLGRALLAVAGLAAIAGPAREQELKAAIVDGLAPYRTPNGGYRLSNECHYLIARA